MISSNATQMRCADGEPITFAFQSASTAGVPDSMAGKAYVWAVYLSGGTEVSYYDAEIRSDVNGDYAFWSLDGSHSKDMYQYSGLLWEISERLDNGKDRIAHGTLTIEESAPRIDDFNSAPITRYVSRIVRRNDPSTIDKPNFTVTIMPVSISAPIVTLMFALDFSNPVNSGYVTLGF